jgi:hypothetical protein
VKKRRNRLCSDQWEEDKKLCVVWIREEAEDGGGKRKTNVYVWLKRMDD